MEVKESYKSRTNKYSLTCQYCGNAFDSYFPNRRNCQSLACTRKAVYDNTYALKNIEPKNEKPPRAEKKVKKEKVERTVNCAYCGKEFKTFSPIAKCCSDSCRCSKNKGRTYKGGSHE